MNNLVFHIAIPRGLKLKSGATLMTDVTFDFISNLSPYYTTVDMVKLAGGPTLAKLSDITLACQVYQSSQEADLISPLHVPAYGPHAKRFVAARVQYTTALAARDLMLNITALLGPNAHVLANFSVDRKSDNTKRLQEFNDSITFYAPTVRSGGRVMPGGRPGFAMAAKGVADWTETTPARSSWSANGLGANATSQDIGSATGGRGKPAKFFASPLVSPYFSSMRSGIHQPGYPLGLSNSSGMGLGY